MPTPRLLPLVLIATLSTAAVAHGQTTSAAALKLSRQSAVEMAVKKNIDLKAEALNTSMAKASLAGSKGIYDPVVTAAATTSRTTFPDNDFVDKNTSAFLGVSQLVPSGGTVTAAGNSSYSK